MPLKTAAIFIAAFVATIPPASATAAPKIVTQSIFALAAQTYIDVIGSLEKSGYRVRSMKTTLLGRIKILAQNKSHLREVVVSRSTGEIKSDRIVRVFAQTDGNSVGQVKVNTPSSVSEGSGSGVSVGTGGSSVSVGSGGVSTSVGGLSASVGLGG